MSATATGATAAAEIKHGAKDTMRMFIFSLTARFNPTALSAVTLMRTPPSRKRLVVGRLPATWTP
jgi:hypothetical protein